ncbi:MAG: MlaD family protein [Gammaproteobacteria bacterium]
MSKPINPAVLGGFVVGAVTLLIAGIFIFSSGQWFVEKNRFVVYFEESVNGLNIGAPVKLHGVQIGKVIEINVRIDSKSKKILTPVVIEIDPEKTKSISDLHGKLSPNEILEKLIQDGLRLQLQLTSLLTGQLYIEALLRPDTPVNLTHADDDMMELPSIKSSGEELHNTITEALSDFRKVPFEKLFNDFQKTLRNIEVLTGSKETLDGLKSLSQTLEKANMMMQTLNDGAGPLLDKMQKTVVATESAMQQVKSTFEAIETVANPDSLVAQNLENALEELTRAARSGRVLLDYLERHPEALIKGKNPSMGDY